MLSEIRGLLLTFSPIPYKPKNQYVPKSDSQAQENPACTTLQWLMVARDTNAKRKIESLKKQKTISKFI